VLKISHIDVFYGDLQALWDVSLTIGEGEIVTLVGSNGAGKSTLMNTISGLLKIRAGSIEFHDTRLDRLPAHSIVELGLSMVPEGRRVFPQMSVLENLEMGASIHAARKVRQKTLNGIYEVFPILRERAKQRAGTLSGGEQQMLAIGRALMSRPSLLMLDEPSLGLSPLLTIEIFKLVEDIRREGVTVLLVEQNAHMALSIASRGYVMESGRIVLEDDATSLIVNKDVQKAYLGG